MNHQYDEPECRSSGDKQAEPAANSAAGSPRSAETSPKPADSAWPERVQATWKSCLQARKTAADLLIKARKYPADAWPAEDQTGIARWKAYDASLAAVAACQEYTEAWQDWQFEHAVSAGHDDPEAGS